LAATIRTEEIKCLKEQFETLTDLLEDCAVYCEEE